MAGISSPAAFKRVNSVTFFSGHAAERGWPLSLAANVFLHRDRQTMLTEHHSVNNSPASDCVHFLFVCWCDGPFNKTATAKHNAFNLKKKYISLIKDCFETCSWRIPCVVNIICSVQVMLNVVLQKPDTQSYKQRLETAKNSRRLSAAARLPLWLRPCSGTGRVQGLCYRLPLQFQTKKRIILHGKQIDTPFNPRVS